MPQDTSVCVYQAGSLSGQPTPVGSDNASLHIAEICIACRREIGPLEPWIHVQLDTLAYKRLAKMHDVCAVEWEHRLMQAMTP